MKLSLKQLDPTMEANIHFLTTKDLDLENNIFDSDVPKSISKC